MGWSIGYSEQYFRFIGYAVPAICDHPDCSESIDRGVSYVCGDAPHGGDRGCGLHFCMKHGGGNLCERCKAEQPSFSPKPDTDEWVEWQASDESWEAWRIENGVTTPAEIRSLELRQKQEAELWEQGGQGWT